MSHPRVFVLILTATTDNTQLTNPQDLSEVASVMASALTRSVDSLQNITLYQIDAHDAPDSSVWDALQNDALQQVAHLETAGMDDLNHALYTEAAVVSEPTTRVVPFDESVQTILQEAQYTTMHVLAAPEDQQISMGLDASRVFIETKRRLALLMKDATTTSQSAKVSNALAQIDAWRKEILTVCLGISSSLC